MVLSLSAGVPRVYVLRCLYRSEGGLLFVLKPELPCMDGDHRLVFGCASSHDAVRFGLQNKFLFEQRLVQDVHVLCICGQMVYVCVGVSKNRHILLPL